MPVHARQRIFRWAPPVVWMGVISALSSDVASGEATSRIITPLLQSLFPGLSAETHQLLRLALRKLAHLTEYGVLSLLWARALTGPRAAWEARHVAGALLICISWAILNEYHQAFVPSRTASPADAGIEPLGAALVPLLRRRPRRAAAARRGRAGEP